MCSIFLSTPSARRATTVLAEHHRHWRNFYPRPPRGGRPIRWETRASYGIFLSTPSARRATESSASRVMALEFLSTPSARRATRRRQRGHTHAEISIHALREEGDGRAQGRLSGIEDFYPRPPRGGRQDVKARGLPSPDISIHALREEGDRWTPATQRSAGDFYPRPPRGGRRKSPRMQPKSSADFYPRPPRGGRRYVRPLIWRARRFLSTPSARRATEDQGRPRERQENFYPRPPRGGRQQKQRQNLYFQTNYTTFCTNLEEL